MAASTGWEDSPHAMDPRGAERNAAPVLTVGDFQAPLDWLLEMARTRKIDLASVPVAPLIGCFVEVMEAALAGQGGARDHLAHWGEWLVMAATLTWLRSRLLVPAAGAAAEDATAEAEHLRRHLLDRVRLHAAVTWLDRRPQLGRDVFPRGQAEIPAAGRVGDLTELLRACLAALRVPDAAVAASRAARPPLWRVTDAIARIQALLPTLSEGGPLGAFLPEVRADDPERDLRCRAALASTLVAGLELARKGALTLDQPAPWRTVVVDRSVEGRKQVSGQSGRSRR